MIYLTTEDLILRDHCIGDLPTHHELLSDPRAMYYLPEIRTESLEASRKNLTDAIDDALRPDRTTYFLRIEERSGRAHVGEIGYTVTDFTPEGKLVQLGYFLNRSFWGRGYTTQAVLRLMRFAFEENCVVRISTGCIRENAASERVMQKCGMTKEGDFVRVVWHDGRLKDRVAYRMLREEWLRRTETDKD